MGVQKNKKDRDEWKGTKGMGTQIHKSSRHV